MNVYLLLLVECFASLAVSLMVLRVLLHPLMNVLVRICPDEQAAAFWISYTKLMLVIAPLLLVLTVGMMTRFDNSIDTIRITLIAVLAGMLIGLHAIGKRLGQFVKTPEAASAS